MVKTKKNYVLKPKDEDEEDIEENAFDSMVENGTSDESESESDSVINLKTMVKPKKNYVLRPKDEDVNELNVEENSFDSIVENGTSDESELENESGDEFSEKEDDFIVQPKQSGQKRKNSSNVIDQLQHSSKKNKFYDENVSKLYKPPTVEEINQLKETEHLFHSNLFRMQIDEMLNEIQIKEKYKKQINEFLIKFNDFFMNLKSSTQKEELSNLKWLKKTKIKFPINTTEFQTQKFNFQFLKSEKPAFIVGSQPIGTLIGPDLICDICCPMPSKSFQKGDYLNLIYDQKRALYLTYLVHEMEKQKLDFGELKFSQYSNNPCKLILEITASKNLKFRIFISPEIESFKLNRFVPWNSNIREGLFTSNINADDELLYASPCYNATVLFDLTMNDNQKLVNEVVSKNKNLQEGLILIKVWLKQRHLDYGYAAMSSFVLTMLTVWLFKQRKLHTSMSNYQVARTIWNLLATSNWNEDGKGVSLSSKNELDCNQPTLEQMHAHYDVVFIDSTGYLNLCANLSLDFYLRLKYEAIRAVELLNNHKVNSFQQLFMIDYPIYTQYDHIFGISNLENVKKVLEHGSKAEKQNYAGYWYPRALKLITSVIRKGLGARVSSLTPIQNQPISWSCNEEPITKDVRLRFGLILDKEKAFEIIDKGPQANQSEAEAFRDFWGSKSQLRRFQDGSTTEACIWCNVDDVITQKRLVVKQIIIHLMQHHFEINTVKYLADQFDIAYQLDKTFYIIEEGENDAENTALQVIKSFDDLGKKLRSLNQLPLDIISIQGVSPVFRYCEVKPILPNARSYENKGKFVFQSYKVNHGIIQLGASGKWPTDLQAFRRLKIAFYLQIAQLLTEKYRLEAKANIDGVHILKDGYIFRVEICHPKEIGLLKKEINQKGLVAYNDTEQSLRYEKELVILPKVTSALHSLYQSFPAFGPTVMIAKRWLYSQLIDNYLWADECTELLIASQFLKVGAFVPAFQPQLGFLRFLKLLASSDFLNEIFIINFNDTIPDDDISELEGKFNTERDSRPPLLILTSFDDKKYGIWSKTSPTVQILRRVTLLARHALTVLEPYYQLETNMSVSELFLPCLDGYDVIINLRTDLIQTFHGYNFNTTAKVKIDATVPAANFNPINLALQDLRNGYSEFAIFFYNPCAGNEIAIIWKPELFETKEFKITNLNGCKRKDDNLLVYNVNALIEDIKIVLKGLIQSIDIKNNKL